MTAIVQPPALPHEALGGGVLLIQPQKYGDERGYFSETFHVDKWQAIGVTDVFVQDNQSHSAAVGTVRALHYQLPPFAQAKLVRVLQGRVLDVAVDIRRSSDKFGQVFSAELTADGGEQIYVPAGFAHGFSTLEPDTVVAYKVSAVYDKESERGIRWNDPALSIDWRVDGSSVTLNARDREHPLLTDQADLFD
ncbi:MAG: dTDP-4-dehydrorhamnose 3,5-epimerase [Planctomycetota bacterium]